MIIFAINRLIVQSVRCQELRKMLIMISRAEIDMLKCLKPKDSRLIFYY